MSKKIDLNDYIYGVESFKFDQVSLIKNDIYLELRKKIQNDIDQILNSSNDDHKAVSNYFKKLINSDPEKRRRLNFHYLYVFARKFWIEVKEKFKNAVTNLNYGTDINFLHDILVAIHNSGIKNYKFSKMENTYANLDNGAYIFKTPLRKVIESMPNNFDVFYLDALRYIKPVSLDKGDIDLLISKADESVRQKDNFWLYIREIKMACQQRPNDTYYSNFKAKDVLSGQEPVENKISSDNVDILFSKPIEKNISVSEFNRIVLGLGLDKTNTSDDALKNITKNFKYDQPENIYSIKELEYNAFSEMYIPHETEESQELNYKKEMFEKVINRLGEEKILKCGNIPAQFINDYKFRKAIDECHNIGAKELINKFRNKELKSGHPNNSEKNKIACEVVKKLDKCIGFDSKIADLTFEFALKKIKDPKELDKPENEYMIDYLYELYKLKIENGIDDDDLSLDASTEQINEKRLDLKYGTSEKLALLEKVTELKETCDQNNLFGLRDEVKKLHSEIESISVNKIEDLADKENRFNLLKESFDLYQQADLINAFDLKDKIRNANSFSNEVLKGWINELNMFKNQLEEKNKPKDQKKVILISENNESIDDEPKVEDTSYPKDRLYMELVKCVQSEEGYFYANSYVSAIAILRKSREQKFIDERDEADLKAVLGVLLPNFDDINVYPNLSIDKIEAMQKQIEIIGLENLDRGLDKIDRLYEIRKYPQASDYKLPTQKLREIEKQAEKEKPEDTEPKEESKPEEISHDVEKPYEKPTTEDKPPKEEKTEDKPSETQNNKSLSGSIFKSFAFWTSSLVTVSGIPVGITTTFIFGIATSGVGGAALLIVVITKVVLFKKQMGKIKNDKKPIKKLPDKDEIDEKRKINKNDVRSN